MRIIKLPFNVRGPIVACGADLKGAFAVAVEDMAYLEDGFGDLSDPDNLARYEKAIKGRVKRLKIIPRSVACDMHPGYHSTRFAETYALFPPYKIQHHEAHIAALLTEKGITARVIGVAFDGTGYGTDGNVWGGEFFIAKIGRDTYFKRVGHLKYLPMPGGELAISQPWRMAFSYLLQAFGKSVARLNIAPISDIDKRELRMASRAIEKGINCPMTSSAGRLFDAAASLILGRSRSDEEAELPIELERLAIELCQDSYKFNIVKKGGSFGIDCAGITKGIVTDIRKGESPAIISSKFHNAMAAIINETAIHIRKAHGITRVAMSGGVFQNAFLSSRAAALLAKNGFTVIALSNIPPNDSSIPLGQIAIANKSMER